MSLLPVLTQNQANLITFVMVDALGSEVVGLGNGFTLSISKAGLAFGASGGTKAEIGSGWYSYLTTAAECDTIGPLSIKVTGAGAVQQNLVYAVRASTPAGLSFTYVASNTATLLPESGVAVWISTDIGGSNVIWSGVTDAFGVARDSDGILPLLDPGTYYFWSQKEGFSFTNPDAEVVS